MAYFGKLYLDEEKDMIVDLFMRGDRLFYAIRTPNHGTGNLISNLGKMCGLPVTFDENGLKTIKGEIPAYIDQYNNRIYIFIAYQAPQSMRFSRQEYWSGVPFSSPRGLPSPGIKPMSLASPDCKQSLYC